MNAAQVAVSDQAGQPFRLVEVPVPEWLDEGQARERIARRLDLR